MSVSYTMSPTMGQQITTGFRLNFLSLEQQDRVREFYNLGRELATLLATSCPQSRELSLAITHLEESLGWATSAIVRNEETPQGA